MSKLTEYISEKLLEELQAAMAKGELPLRIAAEAPSGGEGEAPIVVEDEVVGVLRLEGAGVDGGCRGEYVLKLAADLVSRLCRAEGELRMRVQELATLYRLNNEFAGKRDLQTVLDVVARTVVEVMRVKACSIRLLSEDRTELVIKAAANMSQEYLNKGPILLSESRIDIEALTTGKMVYIADERTDPRVLYPAEARREGIVSALCAPMTYKGQAVGAIRVYTAEPHQFSGHETSLLHAIAANAAAAIVHAQLHEEAEHASAMERSLQTAAEVQRRMIPAKPPEIPGLEIAAVYVPTYQLSGDFYDFLSLPENNLGVAICDVMGKGVRASLLMAGIRASLRAHAASVYHMSDVVRRVNRTLCTDTLRSDFATLFYGVIDVNSRRLTYTNAGHLPPLLFRDGRSRELSTGGGVIGIEPDFTWRHDWVDLRSGDVLLLYTDGVCEAMNFRDEPFGRRRVENAAQAAIADGRNANGIVQHVLWETRRFAGLQTRADDLTIVAVKVL